MNWFNVYGLILILLLMIPNILDYLIHRKKYQEKEEKASKALQVFEAIGRYGCMILMVFNIPYTYMGFYVNYGLEIYLIVNSLLMLIYFVCWIIYWKKERVGKALWLSIIPGCMFLFSSILLANIPLLMVSVIFFLSHVMVSVKDIYPQDTNPHKKRRTLFSVFFDCLISHPGRCHHGVFLSRIRQGQHG